MLVGRSGEKFYLLEVIAFILQYVKDQLIGHLSIGAKLLKTTDFDWVITVLIYDDST